MDKGGSRWSSIALGTQMNFHLHIHILLINLLEVCVSFAELKMRVSTIYLEYS